MKTNKRVPYWLRILAKIILSRLPINYKFWKQLGLFEHGDMNQPARALEIYQIHAKTAALNVASSQGYSVLELGPGDSLFTALVANAMKANRVWMVDSGQFAITDPRKYSVMAKYLIDIGFYLPFTTTFSDFQDFLTSSNATYLTNGVISLSQIPDSTIDFCFSNAVLEHIPKREFKRLAFELKRLLRSDGVCVHRVDLKDHLGGGLENLRFSDAVWEGNLFSKSGFYTNRIRYTEMINIFERAGFECQTTRKITWDILPISREVLADEFQQYPDEELLVSGFDIVLRHHKK